MRRTILGLVLSLWLPAASLSCSHSPAIHAPKSSLSKVQQTIVAAARDQLSWGTHYDNAYFKIAYPGGDLPRDKGVCTDVVIRSLRAAGYDLQQLIHEDMKAAWSKYPRYGGLDHPDSNIDHRRVPNQMVFFKRHGLALSKETKDPSRWKPGDIVCWKLPNNLDHTGVLTDKLDSDGFPYVLHNMWMPVEEDVLREWPITGHFRFPK